MAPRSRRRPLVAGNWKMNMNHLEAIALLQRLSFDLREKETDAVEVVVIPPFTDLRGVQTIVDGDRLPLGYGAQDLSPHVAGAYTGEISGPMLAKLGCSYVVVGHSERREYHAEDDALVARKAKAAIAHGITPIVCVGESEVIRDAG
ncbi:MAG: triosephosphate isomerase, partial [Frankiaceae bacterium]|nr:triosephosphate isomerase [Frankiaceae bacterium]